MRAQWWWRALDQLLGLILLGCLLVCTVLPLSMLQASVLYHTNFANLIRERNKRRQLLTRLLLIKAENHMTARRVLVHKEKR